MDKVEGFIEILFCIQLELSLQTGFDCQFNNTGKTVLCGVKSVV